ncbi:MAG: hypothetical protein GDA50_07365 [Alphaproteobacteria bacterium GM202ARS2]|nr:hypothetical protein [Alphaproteobacteria bacterium GM202ARS2]
MSSKDQPEARKPAALFENIDDVPTTPVGERDTAALDQIAERHGFNGGATPKKKTSAKPTKRKAAPPAQEVRRIGRPRKKHPNTPFNQSIPIPTANAIYDYCRRHPDVTVGQCLGRAIKALLETEAAETTDKARLAEINAAMSTLD